MQGALLKGAAPQPPSRLDEGEVVDLTNGWPQPDGLGCLTLLKQTFHMGLELVVGRSMEYLGIRMRCGIPPRAHDDLPP